MVKNTILLIMNFNTPGYSQFSVFKYKQTSKQTLMMSQHFGDEKPVRWFFFHVLRIIMQNLKCWKGFKNVFPLPSNLTVTPKVYATVNNKITTEMCMTWKFEKTNNKKNQTHSRFNTVSHRTFYFKLACSNFQIRYMCQRNNG